MTAYTIDLVIEGENVSILYDHIEESEEGLEEINLLVHLPEGVPKSLVQDALHDANMAGELEHAYN